MRLNKPTVFLCLNTSKTNTHTQKITRQTITEWMYESSRVCEGHHYEEPHVKQCVISVFSVSSVCVCVLSDNRAPVRIRSTARVRWETRLISESDTLFVCHSSRWNIVKVSCSNTHTHTHTQPLNLPVTEHYAFL